MRTPGEISDLTGIPISTLRRYAVLFSRHLSPNTQGRNRRYTDRDLSVITKIRDLSKQGESLKEIDKQLDLVIEQDELPEIPTPSALARLPQLLEEYELINGKLQTQSDQLSELTDQVDQLRAQLAEIQQQRSRSWLDRLRGK